MKRSHPRAALRRTLALLLAALTLFAAYALPPVGRSSAAVQVMQSELSGWYRRARDTLLPATERTLSESALLSAARAAVLPEMERAQQAEDSEGKEGLVIDAENDPLPDAAAASDNGVAAKTIHPTDPAGYLTWKQVYIANSTDYSIDMEQLMAARPAAVFTDEMPQVLILHTHGTEAYTPAPGEEYAQSGNCRTLDAEHSVVRVGDEIAAVLEEAGISVLHDRTMYDAAGYNDAYARAEKSIAAYLEKYPSIHFVLDVHRDAIEGSDGTVYKVISPVDGENAAQLTLVVGTDGSGAAHENWRENLKFAALLQQTVTEHYPTLMRPMYLRASRYNEHATTGSLLLEVGAAGNSLGEALYAARLFAEEFVSVLQTLSPEA